MKRQIRPIFLVGTPRSGSTLLQCLIAAHPEITSFPESHFFPDLRHENRGLAWLGLASPKAALALRRFRVALQEREQLEPPPKRILSQRGAVGHFIRLMDETTRLRGKSLWLEKTPRHVKYIDLIKRWIPEARFIHILRNGPDNVASLYEMYQKHSDVWNHASLESIVERWKRETAIAKSWTGHPRHFLVRYECLTQNPERVLSLLCDFLEIRYSARMLSDYSTTASSLIADFEVWKEQVKGPIQRERPPKLETLLSPDQRRFVQEALAGMALD